MEIEVSILTIKINDKLQYKVTKRIPNLKVAETKIFKSKEDALIQFNNWLE